MYINGLPAYAHENENNCRNVKSRKKEIEKKIKKLKIVEIFF